MSVVTSGMLIFVAVGIGMWVASIIMESLRRAPANPEALQWAPQIPIEYADVGGTKMRYIKSGSGPSLLLLHTLRTQLDLFQKVIPELSKQFTVYAPDYPGHGFSDIPAGRYDADFFVEHVEGFMEAMDLRDVTVAGVSIGASIALLIAARQNPRLARVVAINPYDYAKGRGMARSSVLARMITLTSALPVVGETVMRLRNFAIMKAIFRGGVADPDSLPPALLEEMYAVGNRSGHYRAFLGLLRHAQSWESATTHYAAIAIPVILIWGSQDWSLAAEREHDAELIPDVRQITVEGGGHFLPLDRPDEVIANIGDSILISNERLSILSPIQR